MRLAELRYTRALPCVEDGIGVVARRCRGVTLEDEDPPAPPREADRGRALRSAPPLTATSVRAVPRATGA